MSIIRDVPVGPPRVWTFAAQVTGLTDDTTWTGNVGGQSFTGSGNAAHTYSKTITLQDVMRWELVRQTDGSDQIQVRHTRIAPPKVHDYDEYQNSYGIIVSCNAYLPPRLPDGTYPPGVPKASVIVTAYGPDGQQIGSVNGPPLPVSDKGGYEGSGDGGGLGQGIGFMGDPRSGIVNILNLMPVTNLRIDVEARRWPSGEPIAGLEVTAFSNANIGAGTSHPFPFPLLTTDTDGNATLDTSTPPIGWPTPDVAVWTGAAGTGDALASHRRPITAHARTQALRTGALDYSQPYARGVLRGNDDAGYFELWRAPGLIQFARASSYTLDAGTWTRSGNTLTRPLSAAQGQSMRQYRYLRVRLTASAAGSGQIHLYTDWHNSDSGATDPPVSSRSLVAPISIAQGANTFEIDLVAIDKWTGDQYGPKPFGPYGAFYGQTRGQINGNKTWNVALPDARKGSAAEGGLWDHHNPDWIAIERLTPGADYVIQEVTAHDLSGTGRTPFRVLGSAMPGGGGEPISTLFGFGYSTIANATVRVLANGRPVAYAPSSFRDVSQDVYAYGPGSALLSTKILSAQDLMDRWQEYYDAGTGVWNLTTADPDLAALVPQMMMEPSSAGGAGFALDALACSPTLDVAPGFNVTVSPSVTLRLNLGGVVEGLLFDDTSRRGGQGKTIRSSIQNPPPGDAFSPPGPVTELVTTADADGYYALRDLFQPAYWANTYATQQKYGNITGGLVQPWLTRHLLWADDDPPGLGKTESSAGRPYVSLTDPGDPWEVVVGHRNSIFFYDLARLLRALAEQDMAQDVATGRIHRVWSDPATGNLTAEAREGRLGLSGTPARAAAVITSNGEGTGGSGTPRLGANPSLWVTHETGLASVVYAAGDGTGPIVRADSTDGLITLGAESMALFSRSGGFPQHFRDTSTGILYAFAAFDDPAGTQTVLAARQNVLGVLLHWADGTTEKVVATNLTAAGRPVALPNRYDGVQSLLLMHGDRRFSSPDQGETWTAVT